MDKHESSKNIFINKKIYKSKKDYQIGGFRTPDYGNITTNDGTPPISTLKIEFLVEERLRKAIEAFKDELHASLYKKDPETSVEKANRIIAQNIAEILDSYLLIKLVTTDTDTIVQAILQDAAYQTWATRIEDRVDEFNSIKIPSKNPLYDTSEETADSIEEAENDTQNYSFDSICAALGEIREANHS